MKGIEMKEEKGSGDDGDGGYEREGGRRRMGRLA